MRSIPLPTQDYLKYLFNYDPETGILEWKITPPNNRVWPGKPAGSLHPRGYLAVKLDGKIYRAHRLIWMMVTGTDPGELEIDHEDTNNSNNRWLNLRLATRAQNCQNRRKIKSNGFPKCVGQLKNGKWVASIAAEGKPIWLGTFDTMGEAVAAHHGAIDLHHGKFARFE